MAEGPVRVLVVTATSAIGGAERQIELLAAHAPRQALALQVLSLAGDGRLTERLARVGIPARTEAVPWPRWRGLLRQAMGAFRPEVVHLFGLRVEVLLRGVAKAGGARVASAIRNTDPWRRPWHVAADRWTARHVDLFVSNSEAGRASRVAREGYAPERIEVIPNGTPLPDLARRRGLREAFRRRHDLPEDALLVGLVANYRPQKGHRLLLEALARVPGLHAVFAGDDYLDGAVPRWARALGVAERVRCLGHQEDPAPLYAALDVFALPSAYEGMPNALMEAMAWGLPCVAAASGGIPELAGADGAVVLVPASDGGALARSLEALVREPAARESLGRAARHRIETHFSVELMVRRHVDLYWRLARGQRSAVAPLGDGVAGAGQQDDFPKGGLLRCVPCSR